MYTNNNNNNKQTKEHQHRDLSTWSYWDFLLFSFQQVISRYGSRKQRHWIHIEKRQNIDKWAARIKSSSRLTSQQNLWCVSIRMVQYFKKSDKYTFVHVDITKFAHAHVYLGKVLQLCAPSLDLAPKINNFVFLFLYVRNDNPHLGLFLAERHQHRGSRDSGEWLAG